VNLSNPIRRTTLHLRKLGLDKRSSAFYLSSTLYFQSAAAVGGRNTNLGGRSANATSTQSSDCWATFNNAFQFNNANGEENTQINTDKTPLPNFFNFSNFIFFK